MDNNYLRNQLYDLIQLTTPIKYKHTCFSEVINDKFVFGYDDGKERFVNRVTKPIAISLAIGVHNFVHFHLGHINKPQEVVRRKR